MKYPEPECFVTNFNDYNISLILYFWISDIIEGRFGPKSDVMIEILKKFQENNIKIPFPIREINISNNERK
jgi:small-conductance mechanosensitive channel